VSESSIVPNSDVIFKYYLDLLLIQPNDSLTYAYNSSKLKFSIVSDVVLFFTAVSGIIGGLSLLIFSVLPFLLKCV